MKQSSLHLYIDNEIAKIMLSDDVLHKNAGIMDTVKDGITNYFSNHINPDDKVGSFLNFIVPGALSTLIGGWLGPTLGFTLRVLNIDIGSILSSIYTKIKDLVSGGGKISSDQIDGAVQSSIQEHGNELQTASSVEEYLDNAKFLKMAVISHYHETMSEKELKVIFAAGRRGKALDVVGRLLMWIIKAAAVSTGLMVAGDAANKMLGRPNAFDNTIQHDKPIEQPQAAPTVISKQTKFPVKPGYSDVQHDSSSNWIERYQNSETGITAMLIDFTKEVYDGLDGLEGEIASSPAFRATVNNIAWYNHMSAGDQIVFIPRFFKSKKDLVDHFIDDVANHVTGQPSPSAPQKSNPFNGVSRKDLA